MNLLVLALVGDAATSQALAVKALLLNLTGYLVVNVGWDEEGGSAQRVAALGGTRGSEAPVLSGFSPRRARLSGLRGEGRGAGNAPDQGAGVGRGSPLSFRTSD